MKEPRTRKPSPPQLRRLDGSTDLYTVTDGEIEFTKCPCCLQPMSLKAATHLLHNINLLNMPMASFKALFDAPKVITPSKPATADR